MNVKGENKRKKEGSETKELASDPIIGKHVLLCLSSEV